MNDPRPYIECGDLFKIYKRADIEVVALRGLDLKVGQGELMAIVGASGSGPLQNPVHGQYVIGSVMKDMMRISAPHFGQSNGSAQ